MGAAYETLIFHDASDDRLRYLVEAAATQLREQYGWTRTTGDLPDSTGLRVPFRGRSWGARVSMAVEEKSIRVVSECVFPLQVFDWGTNRVNVERARRSIRREISDDAPA